MLSLSPASVWFSSVVDPLALATSTLSVTAVQPGCGSRAEGLDNGSRGWCVTGQTLLVSGDLTGNGPLGDESVDLGLVEPQSLSTSRLSAPGLSGADRMRSGVRDSRGAGAAPRCRTPR